MSACPTAITLSSFLLRVNQRICGRDGDAEEPMRLMRLRCCVCECGEMPLCSVRTLKLSLWYAPAQKKELTRSHTAVCYRRLCRSPEQKLTHIGFLDTSQKMMLRPGDVPGIGKFRRERRQTELELTVSSEWDVELKIVIKLQYIRLSA